MIIVVLSVQSLGRLSQADGRNALGPFIRVGSVHYPATPKGRRAAAVAAYWKNYARITEIRKVVRNRSLNHKYRNSRIFGS